MKSNPTNFGKLFTVLVLLFASCTTEDDLGIGPNSKIMVESISIKVATIKDSENLKISAIVLPSNADNKTLDWELSDKSVATLSSSGILTPLKDGSLTVKCFATDGSGVSAEKLIEFIPAVLVEAINVGNYSITDGQPIQMSAMVLPSDAENKSLIWSVSDPAIAEIDQSGLLIPHANGTVTVTISSTDDSGVSTTVEVLISGFSIEYSTVLKAENMLLWQRENGGWPKEPHNSFDGYDREQTTAELLEAEAKKSYTDTTIDNNHTVGEIRVLLDAFKTTSNPAYLEAANKGVDYLFEAQYANGGWPQYYPLRNNYSRHITYNDNAMYNVMMLMQDMFKVQANTQYLNESYRERALTAFNKGIDVILNTQNIINGVKTAWCQQHDASSLTPVKARDYELPSNSGSEAVGVVRILMSVENPSSGIIDAVKSAVAWFESVKISDINTQRITDASQPTGEDVIVVSSPGNVIWARYYDLVTNQPFFCGRDGVKKNTLAEIDNERRTGYAWYGSWPKNLLNSEYQSWKNKYNIQ